jgi:hypothetical protein
MRSATSSVTVCIVTASFSDVRLPENHYSTPEMARQDAESGKQCHEEDEGTATYAVVEISLAALSLNRSLKSGLTNKDTT